MTFENSGEGCTAAVLCTCGIKFKSHGQLEIASS